MTISLSPELDRLLKERLSSGLYGSVEDVLTAALLSLKVEEETVAAIADGHEDFLAGRYTALGESDSAFRQKHGLPPFQE